MTGEITRITGKKNGYSCPPYPFTDPFHQILFSRSIFLISVYRILILTSSKMLPSMQIFTVSSFTSPFLYALTTI